MKRTRAATTLDASRAANAERRKRLGQYFTGVALGRVLAALAQAEKAKTIIDPMAGSGDLLASCLESGAKPDLIAGIEIDAAAHQACISRLPQAKSILGSAFDPDVLSQLPTKSWDLVIANPPYVRYQRFSEKSDARCALPSAMQIRNGLLQELQLLSALDSEDKRLFEHLVTGYSGLSDLAVPSWILCAGLVKHGGRIALVVPESWLKRDYATIVHYVLFRWFEIEFVVEDEHASWFDDAQVKATLIVAKRVKRRTSALARSEGESYCHIAISATAATVESPIGRLVVPGDTLEGSFAKQARMWLRTAARQSTGLARARPVSLALACRNVIAAASRQKWFAALGEAESGTAEGVHIPHEIHDWLSRHAVEPDFETFESRDVAVGQGLRTGANSFFYADGTRRGGEVNLTFGGPLAGLSAKAPLRIVKPVLRRQSELPAGFAFAPRFTSGWALDLRGYALPEDMDAHDLMSAPYAPMPEEVADVVRAAARANFGTDAHPRKVWELTAVSSNIRAAARGLPARHWYMLPDFSPRHLPDVLLPRVNSATPKAYLNRERESLVDANFSTMWSLPSSKWSANALLAFMNSAWAQAVIEKSGAIMGGGALKVEATHLRRLPVPKFDDIQLRELGELGRGLAALGPDVERVEAIDALISQVLGCGDLGTAELRQIARAGQLQRAKHNEKRGQDDGDKVC